MIVSDHLLIFFIQGIQFLLQLQPRIRLPQYHDLSLHIILLVRDHGDLDIHATWSGGTVSGVLYGYESYRWLNRNTHDFGLVRDYKGGQFRGHVLRDGCGDQPASECTSASWHDSGRLTRTMST